MTPPMLPKKKTVMKYPNRPAPEMLQFVQNVEASLARILIPLLSTSSGIVLETCTQVPITNYSLIVR